MSFVIAFVGVGFVVILVIRNERWRRIIPTIRGWWKNPYAFSWLTIIVAVPFLIGIFVALEVWHFRATVTLPKDGLPWRAELPARVWWQEPPTQELENGVADTAKTLGLTYERVQSVGDANLRVWSTGWRHHCKWRAAHAFVSLEANPSECGSQAGDIYVCRCTNPFADRNPSSRAIIAHESAHIFAAQPHFGDGLMAKGGGAYADELTDEEIQVMRARINGFWASVKSECLGLTHASIRSHVRQ